MRKACENKVEERLPASGEGVGSLLHVDGELAGEQGGGETEIRRERLGQAAAGADGVVQEYLQSLYLEMPFTDVASYPPEHFAEVARATASAGESLPWAGLGRGIVPAELFYAYVLYERVNNESLDGHRAVFFRELEPLLVQEVVGNGEKDVWEQMRQAALFVNYWCGSKAAYQPADERTLGPLGVVKRGAGRCGEESTLCVAALRSVGLPARQCYAPYWAHCDDNHAWVEVWTGDGWHYMGACEPEPVLDCGWFTSAASRAVMIRTRRCNRTQVNVLSHYADTGRLRVEVLDGGKPAAGFCWAVEVVNYSAALPVYEGLVSADGRVEAEVGLGDLLFHVWDPESGRTAWRRVDMRTGEAKGVIRMEIGDDGKGRMVCCSREGWLEFDMVPPQGRLEAGGTAKDAAGGAEDEGRKDAAGGAEDKGRKDAAGGAGICTERWIRAIEAARPGTPETLCRRAEAVGEGQAAGGMGGSARVEACLQAAGGNVGEIEQFLLQGTGSRADRENLLLLLREKDLADTAAAALEDAMPAYQFREEWPEEIFEKYVLNPRIGNERLRPYRRQMRAWAEKVFATVAEAGAREPRGCRDGSVAWRILCREIKCVHVPEEESFPDHMVQWLEAGTCPSTGFALLYVALCRSLGLAARLNELDGRPEFCAWKDGRLHWHRVATEGVEAELAPGHFPVVLVNASGKAISSGESFSLSRLEGGVYRVLQLPEAGVGELPPGGTVSLPLPQGSYRAMATRRQIDGSVSVRMKEFELAEETKLLLRLPEDETKDKLQHIPDILVGGEEGTEPGNAQRMPEGIWVCLEPGKEPTEHLLRELLEKREEIMRLSIGLHLAVAVQDGTEWENETLRLVQAAFSVEGERADLAWWKRCRLAMGVGDARLPFAMAVSCQGEGLYAFANYEIGTVDRLLAVLRAERNTFTLEACVDSVESAVAAERGGADRLELCANLVIGGTTPTPALYQEVRKAVSLPVRVLIRPRYGDFCYSDAEFAIICAEVSQYRELGADGVVVGCLRPDGRLDEERMKHILKLAGDCTVALHRAFDMCCDPGRALAFCVENGIRTILTSGGAATCLEGKDMLCRLAEELRRLEAGQEGMQEGIPGGKEGCHADAPGAEVRKPAVELMAGAGVNAEVIRKLQEETGLAAYHMSGKKVIQSGMEFRKEGISMGLPGLPEYELWRTGEGEIRRAREARSSEV